MGQPCEFYLICAEERVVGVRCGDEHTVLALAAGALATCVMKSLSACKVTLSVSRSSVLINLKSSRSRVGRSPPAERSWFGRLGLGAGSDAIDRGKPALFLPGGGRRAGGPVEHQRLDRYKSENSFKTYKP